MACADCFRGTINEGTPTGEITKLHGFDTYVAAPPQNTRPKGIVVMVPDGFGWSLSNSRVLADSYARKGEFLVYLPDFMAGQGLHPILFSHMSNVFATGLWATLTKPYYFLCAVTHFVPFMIKTRPSVTYPRVLSFVHAVRADPSTASLPMGAAGFCWGGKHTALLCRDTEKGTGGRSLIDVVFMAHPSQLKVPTDIELVKKPLSIAIGDKDFVMNSKTVEQTRTVLGKKTEVEHEVVVYEGATHGFAVRGNPGDEQEKKRGEEAADQAINWFSKWFTSSTTS
ncbi:MAG: hypothetical protein M1837_006735 [Sclerophora amabilis]|nr:MAG: hypothetical protein M1837_006735 [Sclerophora amabilis]